MANCKKPLHLQNIVRPRTTNIRVCRSSIGKVQETFAPAEHRSAKDNKHSRLQVIHWQTAKLCASSSAIWMSEKLLVRRNPDLQDSSSFRLCLFLQCWSRRGCGVVWSEAQRSVLGVAEDDATSSTGRRAGRAFASGPVMLPFACEASPFDVPSVTPYSNIASLRSSFRASRWRALGSGAGSFPRWERSGRRGRGV